MEVKTCIKCKNIYPKTDKYFKIIKRGKTSQNKQRYSIKDVCINCERILQKNNEQVCIKCKNIYPKTDKYFKYYEYSTRTKKIFGCTCIKCNTEKELRKIKKACIKCGKIYPSTKEYFKIKIAKHQIKSGIKIYTNLSNKCIKCINKQEVELYHENIEYYRKINRELYAKRLLKNPNINKEKNKKIYAKRLLKNPNINKEEYQKYNKEKIKNIDDSYIAELLKIPIKKIPKDIIETKRNIIKLKRILKNKN